jgi:hypothetical protein
MKKEAANASKIEVKENLRKIKKHFNLLKPEFYI